MKADLGDRTIIEQTQLHYALRLHIASIIRQWDGDEQSRSTKVMARHCFKPGLILRLETSADQTSTAKHTKSEVRHMIVELLGCSGGTNLGRNSHVLSFSTAQNEDRLAHGLDGERVGRIGFQ